MDNDQKNFFLAYMTVMVVKEPRPTHSILLRSYIKWRFFVVPALLIKAKQQYEKYQNKNTGFFNKLYGFCCCAYQNKQKIKSSFFSYAWAFERTRTHNISHTILSTIFNKFGFWTLVAAYITLSPESILFWAQHDISDR
jgi:hypothetical protein